MSRSSPDSAYKVSIYVIMVLAVTSSLFLGLCFGLALIASVPTASKETQALLGPALGVIGGILAVVFGALLNAELNRAKERRELAERRRALRSALKAEIGSIVAMHDLRQNSRFFEQAIIEWDAGREFKVILFGMANHEQGEDIPVFQNVVGDIGSIGSDVVGDVMEFYAMRYGVQKDVCAYARGEMDALPMAQRAQVARQDLAILGKTIELGRSLLERL